MVVITGKARGAKLAALDGLETRPTAAKVKEAVFSMIQFELEGRRVLDLFAGSGQLGIEALSRGATRCVFVDNSAEATAVIRQNLLHTHLSPSASVCTRDWADFLHENRSIFDIIFIDPPYAKGLAAKALTLAAGAVTPSGVVAVESARDDPMPSEVGDLSIFRERTYGRTSVRLYRHGDWEE